MDGRLDSLGKCVVHCFIGVFEWAWPCGEWAWPCGVLLYDFRPVFHELTGIFFLING
jgi:hypothetical protein